MFYLLLIVFRMVLLNKESDSNISLGQSFVRSFPYRNGVRDYGLSIWQTVHITNSSSGV